MLAFIICTCFFACTPRQAVEEASTTQAITTDKATTEAGTTQAIITTDTTTSTTKKPATTVKSSTTQPKTTASTTVHSTTVTSTKPTTVTATKQTTTTTTKPTTTTTTTTTKPSNICYMTIECKSILDNTDKLKAGHNKYVPADGYILNSFEYEYNDGDTAYTVLDEVCKINNIKLTAKSTMYGTYVSGINNIDEFDCGNQSGWLYSVNNEFPPKSCDNYEISDNDSIVFSYICN